MQADSSAFAAAVAARASGLRDELGVAFATWHRDERGRADELRARLIALSVQMAVALRDCRRRVAARPGVRRGQGLEALRFIAGWDRERQRIEDEVWGILRSARVDERRARRQMAARAGELERLARRIATDADAALAEAAALERGASPLGRAVQDGIARGLAELRRGLDALGARLENETARVAGAGLPDFERALARFDAELAARVSGGVPAPMVVRRTRAAAPARKKARVPKFLLARFYRAGGMRIAGDALEITFTNPLAFCIIQGGDAIVVDGRPFPRERTFLDNGERRIDGNGFSETSYLKFPKGGELRVTLAGIAIRPGRHRVSCSMEMRKMGWVDLNVEDTVT